MMAWWQWILVVMCGECALVGLGFVAFELHAWVARRRLTRPIKEVRPYVPPEFPQIQRTPKPGPDPHPSIQKVLRKGRDG